MAVLPDLSTSLNFQGDSRINFISESGDVVQFYGPGATDNIMARLKELLPPWFGDDETPVLDTVVTASATSFSFVYLILQYVSRQLRIATATDGFLDLVASDFFGSDLERIANETDDTYRARILASLFPAVATRPAIIRALTLLTSVAPIVVEPWVPGQTGVLNNASILAFNRAGIWGSRTMPFQIFMTVNLPAGSLVTHAQIYSAIESIRPAAVKVWVKITP